MTVGVGDEPEQREGGGGGGGEGGTGVSKLKCGEVDGGATESFMRVSGQKHRNFSHPL